MPLPVLNGAICCMPWFCACGVAHPTMTTTHPIATRHMEPHFITGSSLAGSGCAPWVDFGLRPRQIAEAHAIEELGADVVGDGADHAGAVVGRVDVDPVGAPPLRGVDRCHDGPRDVRRIGVRGARAASQSATCCDRPA